MIGVQDLRKGVTFELDGSLYRVLLYEHNKTGRGGATIRVIGTTVPIPSKSEPSMTWSAPDVLTRWST